MACARIFSVILQMWTLLPALERQRHLACASTWTLPTCSQFAAIFVAKEKCSRVAKQTTIICQHTLCKVRGRGTGGTGMALLWYCCGTLAVMGHCASAVGHLVLVSCPPNIQRVNPKSIQRLLPVLLMKRTTIKGQLKLIITKPRAILSHLVNSPPWFKTGRIFPQSTTYPSGVRVLSDGKVSE